VVYEQRPWDNIPLVLIKMNPWSESEMARLEGFMSRPGHSELDSYVVSEHPLRSEASFLTDEFYNGTLSAETVDRTPFQVWAATDDRPFFNFLRKTITELEPDRALHVNSATAALLNSQLSGTLKIPMDVIHWVVTGSAAMFFAVLCIVVPLMFADAGRARWPGEFTSLFYFACLGAGFIIIELTLIHVFMKFIGYPLYTYSLVLFTVLLAAGVGSQAAESLRIGPASRWWVPFAGTLVFGALLWLLHPAVFHTFMAAGLGVRLAVAIAMMFPMAFFMGMALPIGILSIASKPKGAIAWAWGMNGLFTTIGGIGSGIAALFLGFRVTLAVGLGIYVLAMIAFRRLSALSQSNTASLS
jgi:hypothetical protein